MTMSASKSGKISNKNKMQCIRFIVRKTQSQDLESILDMIQELADYEKMSVGPKLKKEHLLKDGAFENDSDMQFFHSFVAEMNPNDPSNRKIIGYTIAFFSYSSSIGKCYFIEDIYVKPEYRKLGVGHSLFKINVQYAFDNNCKQLNLHVLDWNKPAISFYQKNGGIDWTNERGVEFHRFDSETMRNLLKISS
uniref:CSON015161 protein n=2 Tax=Culicoides sonorensis TaxID=179676 RepID=A0A336MCI2_CULSO